ncbi:patatin-like phospholipase family protein [Bradyrhizobium sp. LMTR 3]|uniref:patatin-like phospholipase family protein n=1 Tax=Bradyrhizobium sp. LMTR 3 TaxID=189873 RepID=UPI000810A4AE|nr:patatin-like phospholipase family protein [Bradyrhizobium sp. LMTR 3]OCK61807.1 patatin [Bradyrhizobium sp. LMTR 3]
MVDEPVQSIGGEAAEGGPQDGTALCLSGGGYRAMIFHIGVLWRLYETGILQKVKRISSVSGGSITAGLLALKWNRLTGSQTPDMQLFRQEFVGPLRALGRTTIDVKAVILGLLLPGRVSDRVVAAYEKHLFGSATLQDLPDKPSFVINATSVQSGALWRFTKPYMRDYRVGEVLKPTISLSKAVAASSAFPPVLSPVEIKLNDSAFTPKSGSDLQRPPFTTNVVLSDGGVYDNLGLETAWKRYRTILVSDAGGKLQAEESPKADWGNHAYRVFDLVDNQVRSLRKRQVIDSFKQHIRSGAYWGIRTNILDYGLADALTCPFDATMRLAETPTRLQAMDDQLQERLINWGYAVCDAAIRKHYQPALPKPDKFPFPASKV